MSINTARAALLLALSLPAAVIASQDPASLAAVVDVVRGMRASGASNLEVGRYVSGVVDRRITNGNSLEGDFARYYDYYTDDSTTFRRWERYEAERESIAGASLGTDYSDRARWAWDLEYGHCGECASLSYYILKTAGYAPRIMEVPGHAFAVLGMGAGADPKRVDTWSEDAVVVDGWVGTSFPARLIKGNWIYRGTRDPLDEGFDNQRDDVTGAQDNPALYARYLRWAILSGRVELPASENATNYHVQAASATGSVARANVTANFTFDFPMLDAGPYNVTLVSADGKPATQSLRVELPGKKERKEIVLAVKGVTGGWALRKGCPFLLPQPQWVKRQEASGDGGFQEWIVDLGAEGITVTQTDVQGRDANAWTKLKWSTRFTWSGIPARLDPGQTLEVRVAADGNGTYNALSDAWFSFEHDVSLGGPNYQGVPNGGWNGTSRSKPAYTPSIMISAGGTNPVITKHAEDVWTITMSNPLPASFGFGIGRYMSDESPRVVWIYDRIGGAAGGGKP